MFGMLDYRAHKLFWLFSLPVRLIGWLMFFVAVGIGIAVAQWVEYSTLVRIVIRMASKKSCYRHRKLDHGGYACPCLDNELAG